ncbi:hypothetical protein VTL71DRAFT_6374 [Oculimacula yallundae]|uniref:Uncharacterized protein n=1 Tax=Oculimacula yallundae TaxID=86028 RepID=A0ABR4BZF0_9HELO
MPAIRRNPREKMKSSDEYDAETGTSTICHYLASKDHFRVVAGSGYATVWPFDKKMDVSSDTRQIIDSIREAYREVLQRHGIILQNEILQSISPRGPYKRYKDTLILESHDEDSSTWHSAADEIQTLIDEAVHTQIEDGAIVQPLSEGENAAQKKGKILPIRVELRNPHLMYCDGSRAVRTYMPGYAALLRTQDTVTEKAEELCKGQLSSITWVMRGPFDVNDEAMLIPTVMVAVRADQRGRWGFMEEELRKTVEKVLEEGDVDVAVELHAAYNSRIPLNILNILLVTVLIGCPDEVPQNKSHSRGNNNYLLWTASSHVTGLSNMNIVIKMSGPRRKARENSKSSDEYDAATGISTIAFYHASKDPFRVVAGLSYAIPWPLHRQNSFIHSVSPSEKIIDLIRPTYEAILTRHGIQHYSGNETIQSLAANYSESYTDTLILTTKDEPSPVWQLAVDEIQALTDATIQEHRQIEREDSTSHPESETHDPIRVELRNSKLMFKDTSFPVLPGTPAHSAFLRIEDIVMQEAESLCRSGDLTSITWVLRGACYIREELRIPTVLVKIRPGARGRWRDIEKQLQKSVDDVLEGDVTLNVDLPWGVSVELVPGFLSPDVSSGDEELDLYRPFPAGDIELPPRRGKGIGVRGSQKPVSLGPWVTFENWKREVVKGFLTANLGVGSADSQDVDKKKEKDDSNASQGRKEDLGNIIIDYPAPMDVEFSIELFQRDLDRGFRITQNQTNISTISKLVEAGGLGTVLHSSGKHGKNEKEHRMDWSFVRLHNPENFGSNMTASELAVNQGYLMDGKIGYDFPNERIATIASSPSPGSWMIKYGRASLTTAGVVNSIPGACYWRASNSHGAIIKTREIHVMNCNTNTGVMMRPGDEGCMLYNEKKEWVGFGMAVDGFDESAFVTPAREIVEDIFK